MGSPGKPLGASAAALHGRGGQSLDIVQIALRISRANPGGRGCRQNGERYQQEEHAFRQSTPAPGGLKRSEYIEHRLGYELNEMVCAESWAVNGARAGGWRFATSASHEQRLSNLISDCALDSSRAQAARRLLRTMARGAERPSG